MKKKSLALVLATGMAVTTFGGTGSAFADSKNVLSTKKYNETVQSPEFISGDLTGATGKQAESVVFDYLNAAKGDYKLGGKECARFFQSETSEERCCN